MQVGFSKRPVHIYTWTSISRRTNNIWRPNSPPGPRHSKLRNYHIVHSASDTRKSPKALSSFHLISPDLTSPVFSIFRSTETNRRVAATIVSFHRSLSCKLHSNRPQKITRYGGNLWRATETKYIAKEGDGTEEKMDAESGLYGRTEATSPCETLGKYSKDRREQNIFFVNK